MTSLKRAARPARDADARRAGLKGFEVVTGSGLLAPAKTPPATVKVLGDALQKVLDDPEEARLLRGLGTEGLKNAPRRREMIKDGLLKAE